MTHPIPVAAVAAALLLASGSAFSQTATDTMGVSMTVAAECTISVEALDFGSVGIIDDAVEVSADITIQCTEDSPYQIGLSAGVDVDATVENRLLVNGADPLVTANYSLFQNDTHTVVWGDGEGETVDSLAATGADEVITVYGQVFADQNVAVGTYGDTVTATITYGTGLI